MSSNYKGRLKKLEELLEKPLIDLDELTDLAFNGIPGEIKHRPLVWRILLKYLPNEKSLWNDILIKKRNLYAQYLEDTLKVQQIDDPLNPDSSAWSNYYKDNEVLLQIDKDVRRLCPEMSFFQSPTKFPQTLILDKKLERLHTRVNSIVDSAIVERKGLGFSKVSISKKAHVINEDRELHWEVVERILFVYAKLNPGQGYVQGMNEIIGPIYFTLASDPDNLWCEYAEADTFFLFTNLMGEIRDFFIRSLDNSTTGIQERLKRMMDRLKSVDKQVYEKLTLDAVHPQFFSFRWITLLLSQEFPLPEVLRIWDCLFSDKNRFKFLIEFCVAMIVNVREKILEGDFSSTMKLLQNYPEVDVVDLVTLAQEMEQ